MPAGMTRNYLCAKFKLMNHINFMQNPARVPAIVLLSIIKHRHHPVQILAIKKGTFGNRFTNAASLFPTSKINNPSLVK